MTPDDASGVLTDIHSHLVPGVDDGAPTLEDALEGIGRMVERGIGYVITTPHLDGSLTRDPPALADRLAQVDEAFALLSGAVKNRYPDLSLERGHEVKLDLPDLDISDPRMFLGATRFLLVEWPRLQIPPETGLALRRLRSQGLTVVIAHPERYHGYDERLGAVEVWRDEGALLQVNYGSLVGRYGPAARNRALRLLEQGWVHCMASDFHGRPGLRLYVEAAKSAFEHLDAIEVWRQLTETNPGRIARGEAPVPVDAIPDGRGLVSRLRNLFRG